MATFRAGGGNRSGPMEIVKLYLKGLLSLCRLENILGRDKVSLVHTFAADSAAGKSVNYCCRD